MSKFVTTLLVLVLLGGGFFVGDYIKNDSDFSLPENTQEALNDIGEIVAVKEEGGDVPEETFSLPEPLVTLFDFGDPNADLTVGGVFAWTNIQRANNGLPPLLLDETLSVGAEIKVDDMFTNQYFEHVSPSGVGVDGIMEQAGYNYLSVGENLALGNFENDEALVQAWMDSPGHRANILSDNFTEIGISVKRGIYEGRETWLAVQEFGRPRSDCPFINSALANQIENNKFELNELASTLDSLQAELNSFSPKRGSAYNQKVEVYNGYVATYNDLIAQTKQLTNTYNAQVRAFNECIQ